MHRATKRFQGPVLPREFFDQAVQYIIFGWMILVNLSKGLRRTQSQIPDGASAFAMSKAVESVADASIRVMEQ